jgi:outer membrane autotransporter protein
VTPKSYAALALGTTNARTLAGVADAVRPAAGGRGENGFTAGLTGLKPLQLAAVLQQASGEVHADSLEGQLQGQRAARGQIAGRLADGQASGRRVWGEYAADSFRLDGDADAAGFDADRTGMIFGVDRQVSPTLLVGAAFSYGETRLGAANLGSSRTESYQGHVYAAWRSGPYYVSGLVSAGTDQYKTSRRVDLSTGARAYAGRADGSSLAGDVEAGRDFALGPARLILATGLAGDRLKRDALTEGGDAAAALSFGGETRQALQGRVGARIAATTLIGPMKVTPRAALFVTQEFDDTATRLDARLQGRGFAVTTADMGRTAVSLATAADASITDRLRLGLGYQYGWSQGGEAHAVRVRAALTW